MNIVLLSRRKEVAAVKKNYYFLPQLKFAFRSRREYPKWIYENAFLLFLNDILIKTVFLEVFD